MNDKCRSYCPNEPLAAWERELLMGRRQGEGDVTFTRFDGRTVTIPNVRVDSIGGDGSEDDTVIAVEFFDSDRIVHIPFVQSWEVSY